ncbi:MAG TPA: hypothetical protein PLL39_04485 [Rhodocyclaceae bacterium]|nr:hypothetical protein [Rhodocyclaceae bacterium]
MSREINLYDASLRPVRDPYTLPALLLAAGAALALIVGGHLLARVQLDDARRAAVDSEARMSALRDRLVEDSRAIAGHVADTALQQRLDEREAELQRLRLADAQIREVLKDQQAPFAEVLRALARRDTDGIWLDSVEIGPGARLTRLQGQTTHEALIPDYLSRLGQEVPLAGLAFAQLAIDMPAEAPAAGKPLADPAAAARAAAGKPAAPPPPPAERPRRFTLSARLAATAPAREAPR